MRLILLGEPRVVDATGADPGLPAGKPFAALCYIALSDRPVSREALQDLLWPDSPPARGKASVRQALWTLRTHLGEDVVVEGPGGLRASPELRTDLDELGRAMEEAKPFQALELWQGGPLAHLDMAGAPAWSAWKDRLFTSWERRLGDLLEATADAAAPEDRTRLLEHARDLRPHRPAAHLALISELVELGRLDDAEAALVRARRELPSAADRALLDDAETRLRSARTSLLSAEESLGIRDLREAVGRSSPFSRLRHAVLDARRRKRWVARGLCGPAGIGKTHLARHLVRSARDDGFAVTWVEARPPDQDIPYGLLASLVRDLVALPGALGISRAADRVLRYFLPAGLPGDSDSPDRAPPPTAVGDAVADLVEAVAHETPLLVVVDQVQWADPASRGVLRQLAGLRGAGPAVLLFLRRTADRPGRNDPGSLGMGREEWMDLDRLSRSDVEELLPSVVPGWDESERAGLARDVRRLTGGNPGLVTALLRDWDPVRSRPRPAPDGGGADLAARGVPAGGRLHTTVRERMEGLSAEAREAGRRLARRVPTAGRARPFVPEGTGMPWSGPTGPAAELVEAGLAFRGDQGRVRLLGPPIREILHADAPPARRGYRWWVAAAAALAVVFAGYVTVALPDGDGDLPGYLLLSMNSENRTEMWSLSAAGRWVRDGAGQVSGNAMGAPFGSRRPGGGTAWVGTQGSHARAPDVVVPGDPPRVLVERGGDDNVTSLSPDGRRALISTQDTTFPWFRKDLGVLDLETGELRIIWRPDFAPLSPKWDASGRRILTGANHPGAADTVYVLRPDGSVARALPAPPGDLETTRWCGDAILASVLPAGRLSTWYVHTPDDAAWRPLPPSVPLSRTGDCSPDGRRVATVEPTQGGSLVRIRQRDGGRVLSSFQVPFVVGRLEWLPEPVAGPVGLEILDPPARVPWGARRVLRAEAAFSDGSRRRTGIEWRSLTPRVVSTRGDTLVANQPGRGRVVAVLDGWLRDTVSLQVVRSDSVPEALLLDRLASLDSAAWLTLGDVEVRSGPDSTLVLHSDPNARYFDGLMLRELPAGQGLTVELEFRLPLTRSDRQAISLCLADQIPPPEGADRGSREEWAVRHRACIVYPAFELARFEPSEVRLMVDRDQLGGTPVPGLPTDGWVHLGLQVRADGEVKLVVNNRVVSTHPTHLALQPSTSLDLLVQARTADTQLGLRNLAVWRGPRY